MTGSPGGVAGPFAPLVSSQTFAPGKGRKGTEPQADEICFQSSLRQRGGKKGALHVLNGLYQSRAAQQGQNKEWDFILVLRGG